MTDKEKQKLNEKLARWAGYRVFQVSDGALGFYEAGEFSYCVFTDSLDACFKLIVPKVLGGKWKVRIAWSGIPPGKPHVTLNNWDKKWDRNTRPQIECVADTPALALCLAIEKLIDSEQGEKE